MKSITAVSFALAIAGCSSSTSTSPKTGTLQITVSEPTGLAGAVTVTGPGGFHQTISTTQSLAVPPGTYTITAAGVKSSDSIVGTVYTSSVTGSPAVVSLATTTTATVTYGPRLGTGGLWISGANLFGSSSEFNTTVEIPAAGLKSSGHADFIATLGFGTMPFNTIDDANLAFDGAGNLWVVNIIENTAIEYPVSELAMTTGLATPGVTIHLPGQGVPSGMAFDASGNLWVANDNGNLLWELSPAQLTASGSPTPAVTITESVSGQGPTGLAFDAHGNLWVANGLANNLIAYTPSQLARTGTPAPTVTITGPSLIGPTYMAFDKSGNLWVASSPKILEYVVSSLSASGSPAPAMTLTLPSGASSPETSGIAFDESGDLWYLDTFNAAIGEYTAAQLAGGGSPLPTVTLTNSANFYGEGLAFNPHPSTVPLH